MKTQVGAIIGTWERSWILAETNAPASYDAGTTLTLYEGGGLRTILVDVEDEDWQEGRYRSGMYSYEPHDGDLRKWTQNRLVERLTKTQIPETPDVNFEKLDSEIADAIKLGYVATARVGRVVQALVKAGYQIRLGGQPPESQKGGE